MGKTSWRKRPAEESGKRGRQGQHSERGGLPWPPTAPAEKPAPAWASAPRSRAGCSTGLCSCAEGRRAAAVQGGLPHAHRLIPTSRNTTRQAARGTQSLQGRPQGVCLSWHQGLCPRFRPPSTRDLSLVPQPTPTSWRRKERSPAFPHRWGLRWGLSALLPPSGAACFLFHCGVFPLF